MQPAPKAKSFGSRTVTHVRSLTDWSPKWKEELHNKILEVIESVEEDLSEEDPHLNNFSSSYQ